MSNSRLDHLKEVFPETSEEFLSGICNAYEDEEFVTIDVLIDVVCSFETLPPKENTNELNLPLSHNNSGLISLKSEVLDPAETSLNDNTRAHQVVEDEAMQQSVMSICNGNLPCEGKESTETENCYIKQKTGLDNFISNKNLGESCCETASGTFLNNSKMKLEIDSDAELEKSGDLGGKEQLSEKLETGNNLNDSTNSVDFEEVEYDSSPECSIKYLMNEFSVMEGYSSTTHDELRDNQDQCWMSTSGQCKLSGDSSIRLTNFVSPNSKNSRTKLKSNSISRKKNTCSKASQKRTYQSVPYSANKRGTLRSCKVKNIEEKLRKRIINQRIRLHGKEEENNSVLSTSQFLDVDKKYTLLCNIFTDANPAYILGQCELLTDQEKILDFISENLEKRDYPKIEEMKEDPKLLDEFHCTIADFLEVISDPEREFSDVNYIRTGYEENAEIYLKARYDGLSQEDVSTRLRASSYNLTTVCAQIEEEGRIPTPRVLDYTPLHHPANVFFHQEVWYIEHRKEVQDYLKSAIEAIRCEDEINQPPPPPPEEVFECGICAEEIVEYSNLGTCEAPKGHLFCLDCIKKSVEVRIGDGGTTFPCLANCGYLIPLQTVEELLPPDMFKKLMCRIQEEEIRKANIAGVETCPFCPYAYGPGDEAVFTCLNPSCMKLSCRVCRKEDHSPELCEMFKNEDEERARLIIENRMAEALIRTCHSCGKNFVKSTGCNKMECTCGAKMCYVCRQPVQDYNHFNGPGGDKTERCPLFSNDDELHDRPVERTAEQVFNQIAANNPQLKLDREKLIPK